MNSWMFFIGVSLIFGVAQSIPGGWSPVTDLNSPEIQKNGQKAAEMVGKSMNSPYHFKMIGMTHAEKQVVSGMNYKFEMDIGPTKCKKSANLTDEEISGCTLQQCGKPYHCTVVMWVQPWRNSYKVTHSSCEPGKPSC